MNKLRLLFVVHRYGAPGGSEENIRRMAEEAVRRGHDTWVLSDVHRGNQNGVQVTYYRDIIYQEFDMIIVHGSCPTQDYVLQHIRNIESPVFYMLIQPSVLPLALHGLKYATWVGCATSFDITHANSHPHLGTIVPIKYGLPLDTTRGQSGFREQYGITTTEMFLSCGGFWPSKKMDELAMAFREAQRPDCSLVLMGYDLNYGHMPAQGNGVICIYDAPGETVFDAMSEADLYIMNSESEGYGLVLLEAMNNHLPWLARNIAGAHDLAEYGTVYSHYHELVEHLRTFDPNPDQITYAYEYVVNNHSIAAALDSILGVLA